MGAFECGAPDQRANFVQQMELTTEGAEEHGDSGDDKRNSDSAREVLRSDELFQTGFILDE